MSEYITINDEPYDKEDVLFKSDPVLSAGTEIWQAEMADYIDTNLNNWEGDDSVEVLWNGYDICKEIVVQGH